jgi:hypothetical protein
MVTDSLPVYMAVVPCGGIFIMTSAVFLSFLLCPLHPPAKSLSCFYHRYQFWLWQCSLQFGLQILSWPLFLNYVFHLLLQGWCLEPVWYS